MNRYIWTAPILILSVSCTNGLVAPQPDSTDPEPGSTSNPPSPGPTNPPDTTNPGNPPNPANPPNPGETETPDDPVEPPEGRPPRPSTGPGMFGCPTVEAPAYTGNMVGVAGGENHSLSASFRTACAACHGDAGEGGPGYPSIPGNLSLAEFIQAVRTGPATMPSYEASFISDAELASDFEALRSLDPDQLETGERQGEATWSVAQIEEARERGMAAFRTPDHVGVACANCHAPDALDLAFIGFEDADIMRRAGLHVPPELALDVVDLVHAQRAYFGIERPCSPDWHVLQPGGEPLQGDTPEEEDLAFGEELVRRDHSMMTRPVIDLEDARALLTELASTDLRTLPMGIEMPRWSQDTFHGEGSFNDYLQGVGLVPYDHEAWYERLDAYLAEPTLERMYSIMNDMETSVHDQGVSDATAEAWSQTNGRCNKINRQHGGMMRFVDMTKKQSLFLVQDLMRRELLGLEGGWYDLGPVPHVEFAHRYGRGMNPFYRLGAQFAEHGCAGASAMFEAWPDEPRGEIPESDLQEGAAREITRQLNHPWQTLGILWDPGLLMQEDDTRDNNLHYWAINGFLQDNVHLPFLYLHRVAVQTWYWERLRDTPAYPPNDINYHGRTDVHPLLDGDRLKLQNMDERVLRADDPVAPYANVLRCNSHRAAMLLQKALLEAGEDGRWIMSGGNQVNWLERYWRGVRTFAEGLAQRAPETVNHVYGERADPCMSGLLQLSNELVALGRQARDRSN